MGGAQAETRGEVVGQQVEEPECLVLQCLLRYLDTQEDSWSCFKTSDFTLFSTK